MRHLKQLLATLAIVGATGALGGWATYSAFSATTSNAGNSFAAGTVDISDNDASSFLYQVTNQKPGVATTKCIKVTYTGTLDASVKLYASTVGAVGQYIDMTVTPGTGSPTFPGCTGFTADSGGALYTGTLKGFADTYTGYDAGLADNPGTTTKWATGDAVVYQVSLTLQDNNAANGLTTALSTGSHSFTWEARNQ